MSRNTTKAAALSAAVFAMLFAGSAPDLSAEASAKAEARRPGQDPASKMSGTWVLNRELSTGFGARGRGGRRSSSPRRTGALFGATPMAAAQRGGAGGSGDPSDLTPEQRAEQAAMRQLQQIDARITIKAAADSVTFVDSRGERTYAVSDKASEILVSGSPVKVKSKWDKQVLKQEFTNPQAKLVETWIVDGSDHLVLTAKLESMTLVTPERKAVFDRQ
jgi:hypothetical protein